MNILGLVFGLLIIFACTFSLSLRKESIAAAIEKTNLARSVAQNKLLNSFETQCYNQLKYKRTQSDEPNTRKTNNACKKITEHPNRNCARMNLWPLIEEGREKHPALYNLSAQVLKAFYSETLFEGQPGLEYTLLDALIGAAKSSKEVDSAQLPLEKLSLTHRPVKQLYPISSLYYRMLKGTKPQAPVRYPSLLDHFVVEKKKSAICLKHASYKFFQAFFGEKAGTLLFSELHQEKKTLTKERIIEVCSHANHGLFNEDILALLDLDSKRHSDSDERTLEVEEESVFLKQKVFIPSLDKGHE